jgi:hypothetical protein
MENPKERGKNTIETRMTNIKNIIRKGERNDEEDCNCRCASYVYMDAVWL